MSFTQITQESTVGNLDSANRAEKEIKQLDQYLNDITTTIDLSGLYNIEKSLSNEYMSVMVVKILDDQLKNLYGGKNTLIRCYHNRKKFFEMPLSETPKYLDIFHSVIAYILPLEENKENKIFTIIDVGKVANEERKIKEQVGLNETRDIQHTFQGEIEGFKLGYFLNPNEGYLKAVLWGGNQILIKAFNPNEKKENEMEGYMKPYNVEILDENEADFTERIKKIYDIGATQKIFNEYEEPDYMVALDKEDNLCLFRGGNWGREFKLVIRHTKEQEEVQNEIKEILALRLIQTYKVVGLMKVGTSKDCVFQVLTFDKSETDFDEKRILTFNKSYILNVKSLPDVVKTFQKVICLDDFNNLFYVPAYDKSKGFIRQYQIDNDLDKVDDIHIDLQMVMNIIANNVQYSQGQKTKGLLINDFCATDNLMILIHGKVVSCIHILDQNKKLTNVVLDVKPKSFYDFDNEPLAIWMNDKKCKDTAQRWKLITAFRNGEVKELNYVEKIKGNEAQLKLEQYLRDENRNYVKLEGRIVKIMRSRNSNHQPVYFVIEKEGKRILASIEFKSQICRQYSIPGTDNDTRYIILDNDLVKQRQEIICIQTKFNNLRHQQFRLKDLNKEVEIINKEDLRDDMVNVKEVDDIFVCGHKKATFNEFFKKITVFDNKFYYWRTIVGGFTEERYKSNIYFDSLKDISLIKSQCANKDVQVFDGIYPHLNKLQYDSMSDSLAGFVNFNAIKIFPLLHLPRIKIKMAGKRMNDPHILATKYFQDRKSYILITLDSNNLIRGWNMKYGQFLNKERELDQTEEGDFSKYQFHQRIDDDFTLLRSIQPICKDYQDAIGQLQPDPDVFWYDSQNDLIKMYKYLVVKIVRKEKLEDIVNKLKIENLSKKQKSANIQHMRGQSQVNTNSNEVPQETIINTQTSSKRPFRLQNSIEIINSNLTDQYTVKIEKKFIGPHYLKTNFGLFAGNQLDQFIFYYKDGEKTKLSYVNVSTKVYKGDEENFFYLRKQSDQKDQKLQRISIHSPNFKNLVIEKGLRNFVVMDYTNYDQISLPLNLCQYTVETPNFITNDNLSFITEDKIIKSYRFQNQNEQKNVKNDLNKNDIATLNQDNNEEFLVTHCDFPGSTENIDLSTLLKVGNHYIGENCLIYERYVSDKGKVKELIAPNNFNFLFQEANQDQQADDEDFKELKLIQCHYKSKIELCPRSYFGYYFTKKENNEAVNEIVSDQIYVVSTFTYYHWRMLILLGNKMINYRKLSRATLQSLSYVQLSDGSSLLHKLSQNKNKEILEHVYQHIQDPDDEENPFYIPLFKNYKGKTALDITLTIEQTIEEDQSPSLQKSQSLLQNQDIEEGQNVDGSIISRKTAGLLLKNIGKYPFNLFKIKIKRKHIATMIQEDLFEFADFIENCAKTPSFLKAFDRAKIKIDKTCGSFVFETNDLWVKDQNTLKSKFNKDSKHDKDEKVVTLKILDLANIHHYIGYQDNQIYQRLSESKNLRIFETKVIRAMIEQKWKLTQYNIIAKLLIPYLVFIGLFSIFVMNDYIIKKQEDISAPQIMALKVLILLFVIYFTFIEIIQCLKQGFIKHIKDPWNYLDTLPLILILFAELINSFLDDSDTVVRGLYSFIALAMWLRFLYFFRVFKSTGHYIRMVAEVIKDMGEFFFIFGITVFAFAQANFIVFQNGIKIEQDDNSIIIGMGPSFWITLLETYRNSIGDIQDQNISTSVTDSLAWSLLVIGTLFVVIVLFNLLIAIVGNTFGVVQENKANTMYQELVELIVENQFLISEKMQQTKNQGKYLVMVVPDYEEDHTQEDIQNRYKEIKGQMKNLNNFFAQSKKEVEYNNERNLRTLKKVEDRVSDERILKLFETAQKNVFNEQFKEVFEKINELTLANRELQEKVLQKINA